MKSKMHVFVVAAALATIPTFAASVGTVITCRDTAGDGRTLEVSILEDREGLLEMRVLVDEQLIFSGGAEVLNEEMFASEIYRGPRGAPGHLMLRIYRDEVPDSDGIFYESSFDPLYRAELRGLGDRLDCDKR